MMPGDFPQYAELWQEQVDPEELAELQAMAKNIERAARRKRLLDVSLALAFIGPACLALWIYPGALRIKFGLVLCGAGALWGVWRRHEITRASRATAIHDPHVFFEKTIKNVRAEINLSTLSLCLMLPAFVVCFLLMNALRGHDGVEAFLQALHDKKLMLISAAAILILAAIYFTRDIIKLRQQVRRLESMSREWGE